MLLIQQCQCQERLLELEFRLQDAEDGRSIYVYKAGRYGSRKENSTQRQLEELQII